MLKKIKKTWIDQGKVNSSFFAALQGTKKNSLVTMRLSDGRLLSMPEAIHDEAIIYFQNFLQRRPNGQVPNLENLIQTEVSDVDNLNIFRCPSD